MSRKQKRNLIRIIAAAAILLLVNLLPLDKGSLIRLALYLAAYLIVGYDVLTSAAAGIANRQVFDENFLMAAATIGAMCVGDYKEGVAVMWFYQIGEFFQMYAVGRSRRNIAALMDIRPDYAVVETDGRSERVDPDDVEVGTVITVSPGENIPIDGIVEEGESYIDTTALTGESVPRRAEPGTAVLSGSINTSGVIRIRTTRAFGESTASKILDMVENAASRKSQSEQFITKFARIYTPVVCISALALAVLPPLILLLLGQPAAWSSWIYRGLTFLVVSCPCAIVVSIPLSFFGGIGGAGSVGILIKGSNYMETLSKVRTVVLDKTGTLTCGNFEVVDVCDNSMDREALLEIAALAEGRSGHPISRSIVRAWGKEPDLSRVTDVTEISGAGVIACVDGRRVLAGNRKLMTQEGIDCPDRQAAGTLVHVAVDGRYEGCLVIADELKKGVREAIDDLKRAGVRRIVMLTGDVAGVAEAVAAEVGIAEVHAGLLPGDKVSRVETLLRESAGGDKLAFVGDGINDAPVLSLADVGMAMGALGSDAAIEAADVVLMDDDPAKIAKAIRIARKCLRIVRQNIVFAIAVKLACLLLTAVGLGSMWLAIFADVGVMVLCVLNAIRCLRVREV